MEFAIEDCWLAFELRPDTPSEGLPLAKLFPGVDLKDRYAKLNHVAAPLGLYFGERTHLSNSHLALEASEFARDQGHHHSFHTRIFRAYFTELRDIGNPEVLLHLAEEDGLDRDELRIALKDGRYAARLDQVKLDARRHGVNAVPTFVVNGGHKIVGAQPMEFFREQFRKEAMAERTPL
jgi:predicted DsbA family dithiol-disulfide isomerase